MRKECKQGAGSFSFFPDGERASEEMHLIAEILPGEEEVEAVVQVLCGRDRLSGAIEERKGLDGRCQQQLASSSERRGSE
jgi:hypothetical protein